MERDFVQKKFIFHKLFLFVPIAVNLKVQMTMTMVKVNGSKQTIVLSAKLTKVYLKTPRKNAMN